jgi:hypothetical protein
VKLDRHKTSNRNDSIAADDDDEVDDDEPSSMPVEIQVSMLENCF